MKFIDADRVAQKGNAIELFKNGELFAKLTRPEAKVILEGCPAWDRFLDEEWSAKIDADRSPERLAYLAECEASR